MRRDRSLQPMGSVRGLQSKEQARGLSAQNICRTRNVPQSCPEHQVVKQIAKVKKGDKVVSKNSDQKLLHNNKQISALVVQVVL